MDGKENQTAIVSYFALAAIVVGVFEPVLVTSGIVDSTVYVLRDTILGWIILILAALTAYFVYAKDRKNSRIFGAISSGIVLVALISALSKVGTNKSQSWFMNFSSETKVAWGFLVLAGGMMALLFSLFGERFMSNRPSSTSGESDQK
jgi:hypothetical protein